MDVEKLADELRTEFYASANNDLITWISIARRAVELLADKPVATREEVRKWLWENKAIHAVTEERIDDILAARSHFAPLARPRMMIEGMSVEDIAAEFHRSWFAPDRLATDQWYSQHVARVAYRLATTPAPEVDEDEEAKKYLGMWIRACHPNDAERSDEQIWNCYHQMHDGARSFAVAAKKEAGDE